jgi:hypothetical protein
MLKHKLVELRKTIEERIGSLSEEVEIATNVKLNPLYIADRRDEIEFVRWTVTIIDSILKRDNEHKQIQLGTTKMRLELSDYIEFEDTLQNRAEELNLKLQESNNLRESDILINEIDTLESILGRLADLKYGDRVRAMEIAEANQDYRRAIQLRKQITKIHELESEISAQIQRLVLIIRISIEIYSYRKCTLIYRNWSVSPLCHIADTQSHYLVQLSPALLISL